MRGLRRAAVVTGFGPFLDVDTNPSGMVARELDGATIAGYTIVGRQLPVSYERALVELDQLAEAHAPVAMLGLGVARTAHARLERVSRNLVRSDHPDCDGAVLLGVELIDGGPDRLSRDWSEAAVTAARQVEGLDAAVSDDAGGYVCNAALYKLHLIGAAAGIPVGFIHVPPSHDVAAIARARKLAEGVLGAWLTGGGAP